MLDILFITTPIFLSIALGYAVTSRGIFSKDEMRVLGKFVVNIALPALVFSALTQRRIEEVMDTGYLLVYAVGSLMVFGLQYSLGRSFLHRSQTHSTYIAMGSTCSNSGYVGYPVMLQFMGPIAAVAMALCMLVENLLILPLLMYMADRESSRSAGWYAVRNSMKTLLRNPLFMAIAAGLVCALLHIRLPEVLSKTVQLFSLASTAVSLFVIGGVLVGLKVKGTLQRVSVVPAGKLLLHPLCVASVLLLISYLLPQWAPQNPDLRLCVVAFAAMPTMGIYPILALRHKMEGFAAPALLVTTITSFFTLSTWLWFLKHFPI